MKFLGGWVREGSAFPKNPFQCSLLPKAQDFVAVFVGKVGVHMVNGDGNARSATYIKLPFNGDSPWFKGGYEVIGDGIGDALHKGSLITVGNHVELE